jgi:hypothetical protein
LPEFGIRLEHGRFVEIVINQPGIGFRHKLTYLPF